MRAKPESILRSTLGDLRDLQPRRIDAVDARGRQHVADLDVGVAGHEAHLEQADAAACAPPNAALRAWVRLFSTGIAASRSVSSVTSDDCR